MEEKTLNISEEVLNNLSVEQLAELIVEVDDLICGLENIIEACDEALNS